MRFEGGFYAAKGDVEYLQLLDISRRMFEPDPEFQNLPMLYTPAWNGLVEGPTWGAWWIQNSYGPTYCGVAVLRGAAGHFLQNAQDLWFDQMGDGKRTRAVDRSWVAPDGCLCDAAAPEWFIPKQGDGRVDIHDWGMEFTAAGLADAGRTAADQPRPAGHRALPAAAASAAPNFIETRRDPQNNLFLAGPAGNLLAPELRRLARSPTARTTRPTWPGLSVTYIAALDRLIELEKLAGTPGPADAYAAAPRPGPPGPAAA